MKPRKPQAFQPDSDRAARDEQAPGRKPGGLRSRGGFRDKTAADADEGEGTAASQRGRARAPARDRADAPLSGTITALEVGQRNKERVNVYLDETYAFSLMLDEALKLRKGQVLSAAEVAVLTGEDIVQRLVDTGAGYLSYRPRSTHEVTVRLQEAARERGYPDAAVPQAVARIEALGYLDDAAFAAMWVRERLHFKPISPKALRYELRAKGIDNDVIDGVLEALDADDAAYRALIPQMRRVRGLEPRAARQRLTAFLARRGFSYAEARHAIDRHLSEAADLADGDPDDSALDDADGDAWLNETGEHPGS